jgi:tryptophan synthase alpha subunit
MHGNVRNSKPVAEDCMILQARKLPPAAGFTISKPNHGREMIRAGADGTIVGSAFVKIIDENPRNMPRSLKKEIGRPRQGHEESNNKGQMSCESHGNWRT